MSSPLALTGFHAIEEAIRAGASAGNCRGMRIFLSKEGPRIRRILEEAKRLSIPCKRVSAHELDALAFSLPQELRDHRGILLSIEGSSLATLSKGAFSPEGGRATLEAFAAWAEKEERCAAVILDSVTDPHNAGAVLRSAEQLGVSAAIVPESRSAGASGEESVIARASSGAAAWVPLIRTANLARAAERLKKAGFWVYGAESSAAPVYEAELADKALFVLGSEGKGIARLLRSSCDAFVSIPSAGHLDSLNVSVAAGILFYEYARQKALRR